MTSYEMEFRCSIMSSMKKIALELKRANELRAVELRLKYKPGESARNRVEEIMKEGEP